MEYLAPGLLFFGLPLFLLYFYKAHAGVMFFAACAGIVLLTSLDVTFVAAAGAIVPGEGEALVRLAVVMAIVVIAALVYRHTVGGMMLFLHGLIMIVLGLTLWLYLPTLSGVSWLGETTATSGWELARDFQSPIVATGLMLSLVTVRSIVPKHHAKRSKKHE